MTRGPEHVPGNQYNSFIEPNLDILHDPSEQVVKTPAGRFAARQFMKVVLCAELMARNVPPVDIERQIDEISKTKNRRILAKSLDSVRQLFTPPKPPEQK